MNPSKRRPLEILTIKTLVEAGKSFAEIRKILRCGNNRLSKFMSSHGITISPEVAERAKAKIAECARLRNCTIEAGKGGDKAFSELMRGRSFDRILFAEDNLPPIHIPHRAPGDDRSGMGSTFRTLAA